MEEAQKQQEELEEEISLPEWVKLVYEELEKHHKKEVVKENVSS